MLRLRGRGLGPLLIWLCLAAPAASEGRPLELDHIVRLEGFGRASISPDGAWAVYERRGPYHSATRFDLGQRSVWTTTDLWRVDLRQAASRPLRLLPEAEVGLIRGPWSPNGRRMAVYRFTGARLELGVADPARRSVRWTGLTPEMPPTGSAVEWVSDDRLLAVTRPDRSLPWLLRYTSEAQLRQAAAWAAQRAGVRPTRTRIDTAAGVATPETSKPGQHLVLIDARSGDHRTLLQAGVVDVAASPDGRTAAVLVSAGPVAIAPDFVLQADTPTRQRLRLVDLDSGRVTPPGDVWDVAPHLLRWSPDSQRLLTWTRPDGARWRSGGLTVFAPDGTGTRLPAGALDPFGPQGDIDQLRGVRADWLGDLPVLYAMEPTRGRFDWHAVMAAGPRVLTGALTSAPPRIERRGAAHVDLFADGALWRMTRDGVERLSRQGPDLRDVSVADLELPFRLRHNVAPGRDWAAAANGSDLALLGADGELRPLAPRAPTAQDPRILAVSADAVLEVQRAGLSETLVLRTPDGGRPLDRVNGDLADVAPASAVPLPHRDALGRPVTSWLFLPTAGQAVKGLVVKLYPGATDDGRWHGAFTLTYGLRPQVLAGAGYAVLSPALPTTPGEGIGEGADARLVRNLDLAVDAVQAAYPALAPEARIAVLGHSHGAQAALTVAARSQRYAAYVAWAGSSDMFTAWGEFIPASRLTPDEAFMMRNQQGWTEVGQGGLETPPWVAPERYVAASPYLSAHRITAPVLLITADRDFVPMSQSERVFSVLHRIGGRARMISYWGEEHFFWSPANIRSVYSEILDWLDLHLGHAPAEAVFPDPDPGLEGGGHDDRGIAAAP